MGIDFGTSKICMSVIKDGSAEIITSENSESTIPSFVAFDGENKLFGNEAKNKMRENPTNVIYNIKRLIGYCFNDISFQEHKKFLPFEIINSDRPKIQISNNNEIKQYYIEEIIAFEFQKLKQIASNYLKQNVKDVVVGVPAYFNSLQRQIIRDSVFISGLHLLRMTSEPTLAALYYEMNNINNGKKEETVLIFDFGAGFLSIGLYVLEDGLTEVKAYTGNNHIGGEDLDNRIMEYCLWKFGQKDFDIKQNTKALRKLKKECEKAKKILSSTDKVTIEIEEFYNGEDLSVEITREKFEDICSDIFKTIITCLDNVLRDAKITKEKIEQIFIIGGSSNIPKVQSILKDYFNGKELNKSLNSQETVALGAAIEAAIMTGVRDEKIEKVVLLDANNFSLGIETVGGVMTVLIPRNSSIPCKKTHILVTYEDNQTFLKVNVYEGERQLVKDNLLIEQFILEGIPQLPRGQAQIWITCDVDANYNITVEAKEKSSGVKNKKSILMQKGRLSKENIEKLKLEFEQEEEKESSEFKAKQKLKNYCLKLNQNIPDIQLKINQILLWIENNPEASEEEINLKRQELNDLFKE